MSLLLFSLWAMSSGTVTVPPTQWYPRYPDRVERARPRHHWPALMPSTVSPIPLPTPPTELTWLGHAPAFVMRARRSPPDCFTLQLPIATPMMSGMPWEPGYPDLIVRRATPRLTGYALPFGVFSVPTSGSLNWLTTYPARLWPRRALPLTLTSVPWVPTTIVSTATCIAWTAETLATPLLTSETAVFPTVTTETLTTPTVTEEDLC